MFRVVVFSSGSPAAIGRLAQRIQQEVPDTGVCGILLERRPAKTFQKRIFTVSKKLKDKDFLKYAGGRILRGGIATGTGIGNAMLQFVHGSRPVQRTDDSIRVICGALGCRHLVTTDCHGAEALNFVRSLNADLGIVYGTRILKPSLFSIPRLGSINIHKRKVPDYRGGGPVGLWEMLDGQPEIGVTVHEVEEKLDAGAVVNAETIAIDPFDSLNSLAVKAHVVANDLLVRSVADYANNSVMRVAQVGESRMFRNPSPQQLRRYERKLALRRAPFQPKRGRRAITLVAKSVLGFPAALCRNWSRRVQGRFPVMILFHHLIADRKHLLGISTDHFMRHVDFLRRHYQIASLHDAIRMLQNNAVRRPTVVLTVDDGYSDNFLTLRAIRQRLDVPMTMFVSTDIVNRQGRFPHDVRHGNEGWSPLTWDQLRQMQREGFEIGSHTRTHFDCGSSDVSALYDEIEGSKHELQRQLGASIDFFSFPFGLPQNISAEAMNIALETYPYVFSAYGGSNFAPANGEVKHLRRCAHPNDLWELELTLQGVLEKEPEPLEFEITGIEPDEMAHRAAS
jgi:peptidoglycan/xylan/chitin deacetylase (PgdA/CDA1 family)